MTVQTFHMSNDLEAVDPMVVALGRQVEGRLDGVAQSRFGICLSEALTNLVLHAETSNKDIPIQIHLTTTQHEVVVEVFDPVGAPAFDLRQHGNVLSQVDAWAESGRGLGLIMECADRVDYGPVARKNRLLLGFQVGT
ncbi:MULTISPECIES: ATP-binding protein [unclassified Mameliella]|uniref:ATP-binding protein n=1 Tax=unclassified Mameliella TaxID=2630630 RepID=UPI00273DD7FF|nr:MULTISPECIES: ATP-binding protein [unclassified Mameliella]